MRIYLNDDWLFRKNFDMDLLDDSCDTSTMEKVRLPHTVVETPFNYFDESIYQMQAAYRKTFNTKQNGKTNVLF